MSVHPLFERSGAAFSGCNKYRYDLWRTWNSTLPSILFVMLNPSTATEFKNDPTVERCQTRAAFLGFGTIHVANIFAYRSVNPSKLYTVEDPIGGGENDLEIIKLTCNADLVICGWGQHGKFMDRGKKVLELIRSAHKIPHALKINFDGTPSHPLYLPYSLQPKPMEAT